MIITTSAGESREFSGKDVAKLVECDYVTTFQDRGWHCIAGFRDGCKVVFCHADSDEDIRNTIAWSGYKVEGGILVEMSREEKADLIEEHNSKSDYPVHGW